jgi:methyl-accepting chemotaxis protein
MKKVKVSLMVRIVMLCLGLILISSLSVHFYALRTAETTIEATVGQMSLNITRSVTTAIDPEKYVELKTSEDMNKEYYTQLKEKLTEIKQNTGLKFLYTMSKAENGDYYYVVDGTDFSDENASLLGDIEEEMSAKMKACFEGKESYELNHSEVWGDLISGYVPIKNSAGDVIGILAADFDAEYMMKQLKQGSNDMFLVIAIVIAIGVLLTVSISYVIIRSLKQLQSKVNLIQTGDLTVNVDIKSSDEIGSLADSFQAMVGTMSSMIHNIRNHADNVIHDIDSLNSSVDISNKATEEITKIVGDIAQGAITQVESVEAVESSMERVFNEIESITKNIEILGSDSDLTMKEMHEASDRLNNSVKQINLVNDTVDMTSVTMKKLVDKFKEVLAFSNEVTAISSKTNLLALNASIEAASAGEHGKGFAVVAGEIKNLAKQSSDASKHINELINAVQEEINHSSEAIDSGVTEARHGVEVMSQVELYLEKLFETNQRMNSSIKDISDAILHIEEDSKNVLEKTTSMAEIARGLSSETQQSAAETEEQYAIMEGIKNDLVNVKGRMEELGGTVNQFKIQ